MLMLLMLLLSSTVCCLRMLYFVCVFADLSNAGLGGLLEMAVFDTDGEFPYILVVDVRDNLKLNVSMDFSHLNGVMMEELYLRGTGTNDHVDFGYISTWIYIALDRSVRCVDSECRGNPGGRTVSWNRLSANCTGQTDCRATCDCVTRYTAGLEQYIDDGTERRMNLAAGILVGIITCVVFIAIAHWQTGCLGKLGVGAFQNQDDFDFKGSFGYCLQLWDFLTDILLCYSIYDHWSHESLDSPDKDLYLKFVCVSVGFVSLPWITNLLFLHMQVEEMSKQNTKTCTKSTTKSIIHIEWTILVIKQ